MLENQKTKEKLCAFYASDYHFEMISLPYINQNIENHKDVVIFTDEDLQVTIKKLLSSLNLKDDKKEKLLNINWSNNDVEKFKYLKSISDDVIVFIKGKKKYINYINTNLDNWINNLSDVKVIDCYEMDEVASNIHDVVKNYSKMLVTSGEKEI